MADLFLSYHAPDRDAVRAVQRLVQARGLTTFLDRDSLPRGLPWPQALEDGLNACRGVAVFIGRELGAWQKRELGYALDRQAAEEQQGRSFPVVPVLLPGADPGSGFLFLNTWVDLRADALNASEIDALVAALTGTGASTGPRGDSGICPYRGLYAFREEDAPFFHGREEAIDRLVEKVTTSKLAAVVGSSGCGKSSVVMAGLVPRLRRERPPKTTWDVVSFTPGRAPLRRLARGLVGWLEPDLSPVDLAARSEVLGAQFESGQSHPAVYVEEGLRQSGADRLLLVVDQFEELFTEAPVELRRPFARVLLDLVRQCPVVPVLTLRADFYGPAIDLDRDLTALLEPGSVTLGPLRSEELHRAIVEPARLVGLAFDPPLLIEKLLDDVGDEPGNLPLLEYALTELWNGRSPDGKLQERTYTGINGVAGAIAAKADAGLKKFGDPDAVRRVMTSLVRTSSTTTGIENTRRRTTMADLGDAARAVVNEFSKPGVRLLVASRDEAGRETVEVAHEALIGAWAQLQQWLAQDLELRLWRQRLEPSLQYWELDPTDVLTGLALTEAEKWLREREPDLLPKERTLICASINQRDEEVAERNSRRRLLAAAATVVIVALSGLTWWALHAQNRSNERLSQVVQAVKAQLASDDPSQVVASIEQLVNVHSLATRDIAAFVPADKLTSRRWFALVGNELYDLSQRPSAPTWPVQIMADLASAYSRTNGADPPPATAADDEALNHWVFIKGGDFTIGDESDRRPVTLPPFFLQEHEVTNREYRRFDPTHRSDAPEEYPATGVSWYDAMAYAEWLGGSLPTEAQWEFAARGQEGRVYPWGNTPVPSAQQPLCNRVNWAPCGDGLKPVKLDREAGKTPDGVYDLAGNVEEWCRDIYRIRTDAERPETELTIVELSVLRHRVVRGGSWMDGEGSERQLQGVARFGRAPEMRSGVGIRVVRSNLR